uniref:Uncharacterized protein n=1 Tax=Anopheles dirus TaxID=7168 RepID=A0A182NX82_9DIPT
MIQVSYRNGTYLSNTRGKTSE